MKIAVLGAFGKTGLQLIDRATTRGFEVTAVVRDATRKPAGVSDLVHIAEADARDPDAVSLAIDGCDAVISALGSPGTYPDDLLQTSTRATATAMHLHHIRRIVVISGVGVTSDGDNPVARVTISPLVRRLMRDVFEDKLAMEEFLQTSELDWTIVRPPKLVDGQRRGRYRTRMGGNTWMGMRITRADLADALLDVVDIPATIRQVVSVAN